MKYGAFAPLITLVALIGFTALGLQCTKEQTAGIVSTGSNATQVICAVLLDEQSVEHEICDTGAKLGTLLGSLLRSNSSTQERQSQPSVNAAQSAQPASSTLMTQPVPSVSSPFEQPVTFKSNLKLIRLYVKP